MSAYEKIYLGWSNYEVYNYNQSVSTKLGPSNFNTKQAQQLVVLLPDKPVDFPVGDPYAGSYQYFSGSGNNIDNSMTRSSHCRLGRFPCLRKSSTILSSTGITPI